MFHPFQWIQQSIRNVTDDINNHQLLYVTHVDMCKSFEGDTLLAIQAPNGTQLEVPHPELSKVPGQKNKYQVFNTTVQPYRALFHLDSCLWGV